jgi:hypothetical protein
MEQVDPRSPHVQRANIATLRLKALASEDKRDDRKEICC